jgi:hypothetical protein
MRVSVDVTQLDLGTAKRITRHPQDHEKAVRQKQDFALMAMRSRAGGAW